MSVKKKAIFPFLKQNCFSSATYERSQSQWLSIKDFCPIYKAKREVEKFHLAIIQTGTVADLYAKNTISFCFIYDFFLGDPWRKLTDALKRDEERQNFTQYFLKIYLSRILEDLYIP